MLASATGLQAFDESRQGLPTVRAAIFLVGAEFCGGLVELADVEQRIVAKAVHAALCGENITVPFAFGDNRLRIILSLLTISMCIRDRKE